MLKSKVDESEAKRDDAQDENDSIFASGETGLVSSQERSGCHFL